MQTTDTSSGAHTGHEYDPRYTAEIVWCQAVSLLESETKFVTDTSWHTACPMSPD